MLRDPNGNAYITVVESFTLGGAKRYVLRQFTEDFERIAIVTDAGGRIPVFGDERSARDYVARYFTLAPESLDEKISWKARSAAQLQEQLTRLDLPHFDLDATRAWALRPSAAGLGPRAVLGVWRFLWAAGAAPRPELLDPMGMAALSDELAEDAERRAEREVMLLGMKLSGMVLLRTRELGYVDDSSDPWDDGGGLWTAADFAMLGRLVHDAIAGFAARLSPEAATYDVRQGWPAWKPPTLVLQFRDSVDETTAEILRHVPSKETDRRWRIEQALAAHPPAEQLRATGPGTLLSAEALARYEADRASYIEDLWAFARLSSEYAAIESRRVSLIFRMWNDGDLRANDVIVRFLFPPRITAETGDTAPQDPYAPEPPRPLEAYADPAVARPRFIARFRPSKREAQPDLPAPRWRETIEQLADGSTSFTVRFDSVPAHENADMSSFWARFESDEAISSFAFTYEISARELAEPVRGTLRVAVTT